MGKKAGKCRHFLLKHWAKNQIFNMKIFVMLNNALKITINLILQS